MFSVPTVRELVEEALQEPASLESVDGPADAVISAGSHRFMVEIKSDARSASVASAISQLEALRDSYPRAGSAELIPLLVVRHMGGAGAELCRRRGINWLDLDGNADIKAPDLRVRILGRRSDQWPTARHGVNPFANKASRIVHVLLLQPRKLWTQAQLQAATNLDKGSVSRTLAALQASGYLKADSIPPSATEVAEPPKLLDAWVEHYRPRPAIAHGLLSTRDGQQTEKRVSEILGTYGVGAIFGGLPASAAYSHFGSFRRVLVYVEETLDHRVRDELNVSDDPRGRNVLVVADDGGARIGAEILSGQKYTSPILAYLDLQREAERAEEAREEMRRVIEARWK